MVTVQLTQSFRTGTLSHKLITHNNSRGPYNINKQNNNINFEKLIQSLKKKVYTNLK